MSDPVLIAAIGAGATIIAGGGVWRFAQFLIERRDRARTKDQEKADKAASRQARAIAAKNSELAAAHALIDQLKNENHWLRGLKESETASETTRRGVS